MKSTSAPTRLINVTEQVGRYGCIVLMWLPLLVWEFGFAGVGEMLLYFGGNGVLLRHWLLEGFAAVFALGHIYVTLKNGETDENSRL